MSAAIVAGAAIGLGATIWSTNAANEQSAAGRRLLREMAAKAEGYAVDSEEIWDQQMQKLSGIEKIFGSTRQNLQNYYANMDPTHFTDLGAEAMQSQMQLADDSISAYYTNNGMHASGNATGAEVALQVARETSARNNAVAGEQQYVGAQQSWLQYGDSRIDRQQEQANFQQQITANYRANSLGIQGQQVAQLNADADRYAATGASIASAGGTLMGAGLDHHLNSGPEAKFDSQTGKAIA